MDNTLVLIRNIDSPQILLLAENVNKTLVLLLIKLLDLSENSMKII